MPKYWGKQIFAHGRKRKERRAKVGDNNGQAMHGARKHAWRTQAAWANYFAHGRFPRSGSKAKNGGKKRGRRKKD